MLTCQFKELQATTFCLSRDGRWGLLASRRHLALLDMEEPQEIVRKVSKKVQKNTSSDKIYKILSVDINIVIM